MIENLHHKLLDHLYDGVYFVDLDRRITYWNKAAEQITGYAGRDVLGSKCSDNILRHVDDSGCELCVDGCPLAATISDGRKRETEVYLHHKYGHRVPVHVRAAPIQGEDGAVIGAVEIFSDNARGLLSMKRIKELQRDALVDVLTELPNRRYGEMHLRNLAENGRRERVLFGALLLDIDHFKAVNDRYGHPTGDRVLRMVSRTLAGALRPLDDAVRWGGEEFLVLLPSITHKALTEIAERLRMLVEHSWVDAEGSRITVTVSVGGTMASESDTASSVVERADQELYRSKAGGRNRVSMTA